MAREKRKRRGRGEGSVEQLPSGSWRAVVSSIDPRTGKRVRQSKTDPDKAVVVRWAASHAGKPVAPGDTLGQWFTAWLEIQKSKRARQTADRDRQVIETHLRPAWGTLKARDLTLLAVVRWLARLQADGISPSEIHRAGGTLRKIVRAGVVYQVIPANPLEGLALPTVHRDEKRVLTAEQLGHLAWVAASEKHPQLRAMILTQADACLRVGELLGLSRSDLDLEAGALRIRQAVEKRTGKIVPLKTKHSRRTLPLSSTTLAAIRETLAGTEGDEPLFPQKYRGGFISYGGWVTNIFNPLRLAAGFPWLLATTLRHTGASLLLSSGVNVLVVSRRCGHADPAMTLRIYSHTLPGDQGKAAAVFDRILVPRLPHDPGKPAPTDLT